MTKKLKRFMRKDAVQEATGLPDSSLYRLVAEGKFPKPIKLSENRSAWLEDEVIAWQAERLAQRDKCA